MPAKAGIHTSTLKVWVPAFAGTTLYYFSVSLWFNLLLLDPRLRGGDNAENGETPHG
jgi:hypothetical protein